MSRGRWRTVTALVAFLATIAVISTYPVFSQTYDEPAHLAAGMEWLSRGVYLYEAQHPPLPRVAAAIGPYLGGARSLGNSDMFDEGRAILGEGAHYRRMLLLARLGMLPFFGLLLAICALCVSNQRSILGDRYIQIRLRASGLPNFFDRDAVGAHYQGTLASFRSV